MDDYEKLEAENRHLKAKLASVEKDNLDLRRDDSLNAAEEKIKELEAELSRLHEAIKVKGDDEPRAWLTDRDTMYFDKEDAKRDSDGFIQPLSIGQGSSGEIVITTNSTGQCVAVTRQDDEGKILSVIWEAKHERSELADALLTVVTYMAESDTHSHLFEMEFEDQTILTTVVLSAKN